MPWHPMHGWAFISPALGSPAPSTTADWLTSITANTTCLSIGIFVSAIIRGLFLADCFELMPRRRDGTLERAAQYTRLPGPHQEKISGALRARVAQLHSMVHEGRSSWRKDRQSVAVDTKLAHPLW